MPPSGVSANRSREALEQDWAFDPPRPRRPLRAVEGGASPARAARPPAPVRAHATEPARADVVPGRATETEPGRATGVPGRRTITITGRGAERRLEPTYARRRPQRRPHERPGFQPDRAAMWAVLLGVLLVLVAATSSHAATRAIAPPATGGHVALVVSVSRR